VPSTSAHPDLAVVVLAAGHGTRFRSDTAKVLHRAAGRSLLRHVLEAVRGLRAGRVVVVVAHQAEAVVREAKGAGLDGLVTVDQGEPRGTGHAVQQAVDALGDAERVMILPGDTPLLTADALTALASMDGPAALLTAEFADPSGYGRVVRAGDGTVERIVEEVDADDAERAITEANAGMYVVRRDLLVRALGTLDDDNAQGELYLTDVVAALRADGHEVRAVRVDEAGVAGVNDRRQLADAAASLRRRHLDRLMVDVGVSVVDPDATWVDVDVEVGRDAVLLPGTILDGATHVGEGAVVGPNAHLTGCVVGARATVHSSRCERAEIGEDAAVGPFAHLRPGTVLDARAKVGAFAETKNSRIGAGSKVPHLAYVGDATVGADVNVACGVITVNYDGRDKHRTIIEDGAFVGCDTMLVAPVTIGAGAYTAAGSTITEDVPPGALAIARARQVVKGDWVAHNRS
jgi:bifunctional UDP-N-acetylglucosamine pyrophosphorylase / glucosamine-1-phosphate N-acetyltransferase